MSGDEAVSQIQVRCLSRPQFGPRISSGEQKPNHSVQPSFRNGRGLVFVRLSIILSLASSWVTCLCRKCVFIYNKPNYYYNYLLCTCFHCENQRKLKSLGVSCINTHWTWFRETVKSLRDPRLRKRFTPSSAQNETTDAVSLFNIIHAHTDHTQIPLGDFYMYFICF